MISSRTSLWVRVPACLPTLPSWTRLLACQLNNARTFRACCQTTFSIGASNKNLMHPIDCALAPAAAAVPEQMFGTQGRLCGRCILARCAGPRCQAQNQTLFMIVDSFASAQGNNLQMSAQGYSWMTGRS